MERSLVNVKTPEMVGISFKVANSSDTEAIVFFLSRPEIDELFTPRLSDPARGISIQDRVKKKLDNGWWVIAVKDGEVVGSMAVVSADLPLRVPDSDIERGIKISEGIPIKGWRVDKFVELSTVVVDPQLRLDGVKGVGAGILAEAKKLVEKEGKERWGLITDSWIGGDMGGFVDSMNRKASVKIYGEERSMDTLIRIYSDPKKRGASGPLTVIYGIPISEGDWEFFENNQRDIEKIRDLYNSFL